MPIVNIPGASLFLFNFSGRSQMPGTRKANEQHGNANEDTVSSVLACTRAMNRLQNAGLFLRRARRNLTAVC